ncbi:hypothetical protein [Cryptosporangium phraense]|uniref:Uncharacterized protein n=1 Tax=Cryptosporangium phraense TaxID=2593070 RepID=A0A545AZU2_9ACTN|nr:hypothetical protein [Cryptosporangium phraense]TQS46856.1 hypothetical protein FL583_00835 [Cryptosporangium phraense]
MLFVLAATSCGIGLLILLSAGTGAGTPFGVGFAVLLVLGSVIGSRWGRGPVARGVRAPQLVAAGAAGLVLLLAAAALCLWRPGAVAGLPIWPFLLCMAISGWLMVLVGMMGTNKSSVSE